MESLPNNFQHACFRSERDRGRERGGRLREREKGGERERDIKCHHQACLVVKTRDMRTGSHLGYAHYSTRTLWPKSCGLLFTPPRIPLRKILVHSLPWYVGKYILNTDWHTQTQLHSEEDSLCLLTSHSDKILSRIAMLLANTSLSHVFGFKKKISSKLVQHSQYYNLIVSDNWM